MDSKEAEEIISKYPGEFDHYSVWKAENSSQFGIPEMSGIIF